MGVSESEVYEGTVRADDVPASDNTLYGPEVPTGRVVRLELFLCIDQTTANKTITLGIEQKGVQRVLREAGAGTSLYEIHMDVPMILLAGEKPFATVTSPTAGDHLTLFVRGLYI